MIWRFCHFFILEYLARASLRNCWTNKRAGILINTGARQAIIPSEQQEYSARILFLANNKKQLKKWRP
jgi:hypothetical protein